MLLTALHGTKSICLLSVSAGTAVQCNPLFSKFIHMVAYVSSSFFLFRAELYYLHWSQSMATETAFTIGILQIMLLWIWCTNISFGPIFNSPMQIPRSGVIKCVLVHSLSMRRGCWVFHLVTLYLIPLRQSLSLTRELGWQSASSGAYMTILALYIDVGGLSLILHAYILKTLTQPPPWAQRC